MNPMKHVDVLIERYPELENQKENILEVCKKIKPDGVCSIASDLASITVNYVAENLG